MNKRDNNLVACSVLIGVGVIFFLLTPDARWLAYICIGLGVMGLL